MSCFLLNYRQKKLGREGEIFRFKLDVAWYLIIEILFVEGPLCVEIRPPATQISHPTKELICVMLTFPWNFGYQLWSCTRVIRPCETGPWCTFMRALASTFDPLFASGMTLYGLTLFYFLSFYEPRESLKTTEEEFSLIILTLYR